MGLPTNAKGWEGHVFRHGVWKSTLWGGGALQLTPYQEALLCRRDRTLRRRYGHSHRGRNRHGCSLRHHALGLCRHQSLRRHVRTSRAGLRSHLERERERDKHCLRDQLKQSRMQQGLVDILSVALASYDPPMLAKLDHANILLTRVSLTRCSQSHTCHVNH